MSRHRRDTIKIMRDNWDDRLLRRVIRFLRNGRSLQTANDWGPLSKPHPPIKRRP